jgi:glycosyltransferase involved in cell wall biosynthesis
MISVIIPLYNKRKTIGKTIESILNQTDKDLEIIVVDDGSSDDSISAILVPAEISIKTIIRPHSGAPAARNSGAKEARGEYLFFCDADVVLKPDVLEKMKIALEKNPGTSYAYCSFRLGRKVMPAMPFDAEKLKKINYISTMSLIRRADFPGFDEQLKRFQDWDLWLTMLERGKTGIFVPGILFYAEPGRGMSRWLPRIFYKLSWLPSVKKYNDAAKMVRKKHNLL